MLKRAGGAPPAPARPAARKGPTLESFIDAADFIGAVTLLEFQLRAGEGGARAPTLAWLAWAAFHAGDYRRALEAYAALDAAAPAELDALPGGAGARGALAAAAAAAHFYAGDYARAEAAAAAAPESPLKHRVLLHAAFRRGGDGAAAAEAAAARVAAGATRDDALSLAALSFARGAYGDAADAYKRLLAEGKDDVALYAFLALCLYKLDNYEQSLEALSVYLQAHPASSFAINLKACNHFKLYNGKAAEAEIKVRARGGAAAARRGALTPPPPSPSPSTATRSTRTRCCGTTRSSFAAARARSPCCPHSPARCLRRGSTSRFSTCARAASPTRRACSPPWSPRRCPSTCSRARCSSRSRRRRSPRAPPARRRRRPRSSAASRRATRSSRRRPTFTSSARRRPSATRFPAGRPWRSAFSSSGR